VETWPGEWQSYADKLRDRADVVLEMVRRTVRRRESGFNVLIHGDLWVNNILLRGQASAAQLVDFQMTHFTSPVLDIHYFVTTSATLEVRINHTGRLLEVSSFHTG
jgi:aminoglycoside phosphotransferase (APT) family kinase protein